MNREHKKQIKFLLKGAAVGASFLIARYLVTKWQQKRDKSVPSMIGLPIVGSILSIGIYSTSFFSRIAPSYGPIMGFSMGSQETVLINDAKLMQTIFRHNLLRFRPKYFQNVFNQTLSFGVVNDDDFWSQRRKFMMESVVAIGSRDYVVKQVQYLLDSFLYSEIDSIIARNEVWNPRQDLRHAVFNMLSILFT